MIAFVNWFSITLLIIDEIRESKTKKPYNRIIVSPLVLGVVKKLMPKAIIDKGSDESMSPDNAIFPIPFISISNVIKTMTIVLDIAKHRPEIKDMVQFLRFKYFKIKYQVRNDNPRLIVE